MTFRRLTLLTSALCLLLAVVWLSFPEWILTHWSVGYGYDGGLVSRRMACLFFALSVLLFGLRKVEAPDLKSAVRNGVIAACMSLAALGVYELVSGHAGVGILFAIGLEALVTLAFVTLKPGEERVASI